MVDTTTWAANDRVAIVERLRNNLQKQTPDLGAEVSARSTSTYVAATIHAAEQSKIFANSPLVVGHSSQLPSAGDFITVNFAGPPLLIVRGADGALRAFLNTCRHRGAIVTTDAYGHRSSFVCPYHGWTYALDGALSHITDAAAFAGAEHRSLGLISLPVAERQGLIFVRTTPGSPLDGDALLGPLDAQFAAFDLAEHQHFRTETINTKFNWKIGVEGSLETYHFPFIHGKTAAKIFSGASRIYDHYAPHQRFAVAKKSLLEHGDIAQDMQSIRDQILFTYFIFPNTLVSFPNDHALITSFYPRGVDGCTMIYQLLTPPGEAATERSAHWERTWQLTRSVLSEDFAVQEGIQRGASTGPAASILFGHLEQGLSHFHAACDAALSET